MKWYLVGFADRLPWRHALVLSGLLMLLVWTAILELSRHIAVLVIVRILQGFSAAVVWTSGLAYLQTSLAKKGTVRQ